MFFAMIKLKNYSLVTEHACLEYKEICTYIHKICFTPFTQLLQTRVCFTNAGINNNKICGGKKMLVSISSYLDEISHR